MRLSLQLGLFAGMSLAVTTVLAADGRQTLVISALDWQDEPVPGVTFEVSSPSHEPLIVRTNDAGQGVLQPEDYAVPGTVRLIDTDWTSAQPSLEMLGNAPIALFTLFRSNPNEMAPGERWAYAKEANPMRTLAEEARVRAALGLIERYREIVEAPMLGGSGEEDETPAVAVRVLGALGEAKESVTVYLYMEAAGEGTAHIAGFERTDARGEVLFGNLPPGRTFRVQATSGSLVARSGFATSPAEGAVLLEPLVLREEEAFVDGLVADAGEPVPEALVRVVDGSRVLATSTDEWGYFQLGPLRGETVRLQVNAPTGGRTAEMTVDAGSGELYLPLEILAPAEPE